MKTKHFIKEHRFRKISDHFFKMEADGVDILFNDEAIIVGIHGIKPTPQQINTIENLIITYLDDLYLSEFEEIKSYHEDTTK